MSSANGDGAEHGGLILRAEIVRDGDRIMASTVELGETTALVITEETAFVGDHVQVRLSFPGLLDTFEIEAQVVSQRVAGGPGEPRGWWLGWVFRDDAEQESLRRLLEGAESAPTESRRLRILLVEDSQLTREAFLHSLERFFGERRATLSVDVAEDGTRAWQMLSATDYDLAIVDYYLPGENGDGLIARIRRDSRWLSLPVLAVSQGGEARDATLAAGADFFLRKPIAPDDLYRTLHRLKLEKEAR